MTRHAPVALSLLGALCLASLPLAAQQAAPPAAPAERTAGQTYKNVQVLKDMPVSQFGDAMVYMNAATGQNCLGCHVRQPDGTWLYEKDDKDHKTIARTMIGMTTAINAQHFKGEPEVTCATCHQGRTSPAAFTPMALPLTADQLALAAARAAAAPRPGGAPAGGPPAPGATRPAPSSEGVDQVFERYIAALGGHDALAQVRTRVMKGTVATRQGQTVPFTLEERADGAYRSTAVAGPSLEIVEVVDGAGAWMRYGADLRDYERVEVATHARFQELGLALRLKDTLSRAAMGRPDRIDGREVIVVNAQSKPDVTETWSFDKETGLLLRRVFRPNTVLGRVASRVDFGDYRTVGAIKVPHKVVYTKWDAINTVTFTEVTLNPTLDPGRFRK